MRSIITCTLYIIGACALFYAALIRRFMTPDRTETQLLMDNWQWFLLALGCIFIAMIFESAGNERRKHKESGDDRKRLGRY